MHINNVVRDIERLPIATQIRQPTPGNPGQPALRQTLLDRLPPRHLKNNNVLQTPPPQLRQDAPPRHNNRHRLRLPQRGRHA